MSDLREYFLQNLGIGEIWKARDFPLVGTNQSTSVKHEQAKQRAALPTLEVNLSETPRPERLKSQAYTQLDELEVTISQCDRCDLCQRLGKSQLAVKHAEVDILIVSEFSSPLESDLREKLIQNVANVLARSWRSQTALRIMRSSAIRARAPMFPDRGNAAANMATCTPFLKQEIDAIQPRAILILGSEVATALLDMSPDCRTIDLRQNLQSYRNSPVVVTFGETELIENPALKALVWEDICKLNDAISLRN